MTFEQGRNLTVSRFGHCVHLHKPGFSQKPGLSDASTHQLPGQVGDGAADGRILRQCDERATLDVEVYK
jgi:hypothetical protein